MIINATCQHCHQVFESDGENKTEFCPHCGKETAIKATNISPLPPAAFANASRLVTCGDCGHQNSKGAVFCPHCGKFINVPFRLVWMAVGYSICAFALFNLIRLLMDEVFKAVTS
jgi:transcription elongation factor Elf1